MFVLLLINNFTQPNLFTGLKYWRYFFFDLHYEEIRSKNITNSVKDPKFDRYEQQMYHEPTKIKDKTTCIN